jgi:MYXO-CTERM domain-containing protein
MIFLFSLFSIAVASGDLPQNALENWEAPLISVAPGTRFAAIVEATDEDPVVLDVYDGSTWRTAKEVFRIRNRALLQIDLAISVDQVWVRSPDQHRIRDLQWELLVPVNEPKGPPQPPTPGVLPQEIKDLGVISRADWGARPTTCVTTEDDWYRMAIHHTAGVQEQNGSVKELIQWLQVYFQETRGYCDIAYQFLVAWDGTVWEGRPYDYYSGATGGGNNNGNSAISFVGCYDGTACDDLAGPHWPSDETLNSAHNLIYTLSQIEDIPTDSDHIKGHQDWPGNATACPGDRILARIPDWFSAPGPDFSASLTDSSFAFSDEAPIVLKWGESVSGYLEFENTGRSTWNQNTLLAPLPKDEPSPVFGEDWDSKKRVTSSDENPAPGNTGRFSFSLKGREPGVYYQEFSLLQENESWFDGDGGVTPDEIVLRIVVSEERVGADSGEPSETGETGDTPTEEKGGCGCTASPTPPRLLFGFLGLMSTLLIRRRR